MVSNSMLISLLLAGSVFAAFLDAAPIEHESRHKRDLMIEMDDDEIRDLLQGDFGDSDLLSRKRRDLMIESEAGSDDASDFGKWLLEYADGRVNSHVDELPIGKRSVSEFAGIGNIGKYQQAKKSGSLSGKKKSIYVWFPDDTKHARRPSGRIPVRIQQSPQQQFHVSDTFKFMN